MKKIACNILILCGTKILLGHRRTMYANKMWCLPGGHMNKNEDINQCTSRELYEETGIVNNKHKIFLVINEVNKKNEFCHYFSYLKIIKNTSNLFTNNEPNKFYYWSLFDYVDIPKNIISTHKLAIDYFLFNNL